MSEKINQALSPEQQELERRREKIKLAQELIDSNETFAFPGFDPGYVDEMRIERDDPDLAGFLTPMHDLLTKLQNEGFKVSLGDNPESGNVFVLPKSSTDIVMDGVLIRCLASEGVNDERLLKLISI